jgi:aminoglycoside 3-N-acetyltransferase
MPAFTYKTMVTPEVGPPDNGIEYGEGREANQFAEFFRPDIPADPLMGIVAETLRQHPQAIRSHHPIYSFAGVNADFAIQAQSLKNPFGPIQALEAAGGWVMLLGVDHTVNTSIHYAEQVAGRNQFIRWALTPQGVIECPGWPGCSYGFNKAAPKLMEATTQTRIGSARVRAIPLRDLVEIITNMIDEDPLALLCDNMGCERCNEIRKNHTHKPN